MSGRRAQKTLLTRYSLVIFGCCGFELQFQSLAYIILFVFRLKQGDDILKYHIKVIADFKNNF